MYVCMYTYIFLRSFCYLLQTHLAEKGGLSRRAGAAVSTASVDSARANLASSFVNAFVNAGFGADKLMLDATAQQGNDWIYKNKVS